MLDDLNFFFFFVFFFLGGVGVGVGVGVWIKVFGTMVVFFFSSFGRLLFF